MKRDPADDRRDELLRHVLRGLPSRRAPRTLEARVWAELRHRACRVWWQRSFGSWPVQARMGFIVVSLALVRFSALDGALTASTIDRVRSAGVAITAPMQRALGWVPLFQELGRVLTRAIPATWWYRGSLVAGLLYCGVFGIGALVYRTLYVKTTGEANE